MKGVHPRKGSASIHTRLPIRFTGQKALCGKSTLSVIPQYGIRDYLISWVLLAQKCLSQVVHVIHLFGAMPIGSPEVSWVKPLFFRVAPKNGDLQQKLRKHDPPSTPTPPPPPTTAFWLPLGEFPTQNTSLAPRLSANGAHVAAAGLRLQRCLLMLGRWFEGWKSHPKEVSFPRIGGLD